MSDYPRCKTCQWWGEHLPGDGAWGKCALSESDDGEPLADTLAYAVDAETWHASLSTHETFGCIQHQPNRTPNDTE